MAEAVLELHEKRGPTYRRWHARLRAALDDPRLDAPNVSA